MTDEDEVIHLNESDSSIDDYGSSSTPKIRTKKKKVKPKVCSKWCDNEIFKLISCVESSPILWNVKDEKYRDKIERQSTWKEMSEVNFNNKFSSDELMAKWSNMRIQYRSYFSKYRKTKSGQGASEAVKWKFYKEMDFVDRAEDKQTAITVSNLVKTEESTVDSLIDQSLTSAPPPVKQQRLLSTTTNLSSPAYIVAEVMKDAVKQLNEQRRKREDEFDAFGKYVATELRAISDPSAAQRVRFKVARCLMDCIEAENL